MNKDILTLEVGRKNSYRLSLLKRLITHFSDFNFHVVDLLEIEIESVYKKCNYINVEDVITGDYSNVDWFKIPPPDIELLEKMANTQLEFYNMLERFKAPNNSFPLKQNNGKSKIKYQINRFYKGELSHFEKERLYLKHVRYWSWYLRHHNISLIIYLDTAPHFGYDYIIYKLASLFSIRTIHYVHGIVSKYKIFINDYKENYENIKKQIELIDPTRKILNDDFKEEFSRLTKQDTSKQKMPKYMYGTMPKYIVPNDTITKKIKRLFNYMTFDGLDYLFRLRNNTSFNKDLNEYYDSNIYTPKKSDKYIYVPLHFQPEMTSCPLGDKFYNQLLQVEYLSYCIPDNVFLYVKEHPRQELVYKGYDFYNQLLSIKNVRLISRKESNYKLLENCIAVSTLIGTAGWEGLFKNKPFLMFGHHFYKVAPGVFYINSLESCKEAVDTILNEDINISLEDLKKVFLWFQDNAILFDVNNNLKNFGDELIKQIELGLNENTIE